MTSGTDHCPQTYGFAAEPPAPRLRLVPPPSDALYPPAVPTEVDQAISVASRAYDILQRSGRRLHFAPDRAEGTVAILQDLHGNPLDTLSGSQVLRIAGGGSLS
jgi:hypothetical protein